MSSLLSMFLGVFEQGTIYAILALGIYITYKILDFPDLTVDGSFPLGAAITASLVSRNVNPYFVLLISFIAGMAAGVMTGIIHVKFKVRDLLSSIIVMTGLYTINLRIAGSANVPIFGCETIFSNSFLNRVIPDSMRKYQVLIIVVIIVLLSKLFLDFYLHTKSGYLLRATGDNVTLITSLAEDCGKVKIYGLALANGFVSLSGSVLCQQQRYFDISSGTGTMILGLASVIIGISLFKKIRFVKPTTAVILGSIIYKMCVALAIRWNLSASDMKLLTAILFLAILVVSMDRKKGKKIG